MPIRRHPHLLELSAWPWLDRLSRKAGRLITLGNVPEDAWDAYAAQGFDVVLPDGGDAYEGQCDTARLRMSGSLRGVLVFCPDRPNIRCPGVAPPIPSNTTK